MDNRVAIVTGSGQGIGRAIALGMARAGAHLVIAERRPESAEAVAVEVRALGRKAISLPADVKQADQVAGIVAKTVGELGRIDVLVNNVGGGIRAPAMELEEKAWDLVMRMTLKTAFLGSQAVARHMKDHGGGAILNISSVEGLLSAPLMSPYAAAKAAIINLTRTLAAEWAQQGIRVNAIAPGFVETPGVLQFLTPEMKAGRTSYIPMGRYGQPDDMVGAAVFLASDAAAYITGHTLVVDGGLTARRPGDNLMVS
ncbi:MAG: 3-oxoacyl-ACP reductase family protein [Dehalococcoidia bacterium]|nr:3-oxoacyl-ACP reductase family protein [Dehalococcoidia bacterium]MDP7240131.1 3-oxoacyl-ACP reductase family protein [Dehalococcoidia bacterium]MDP7470567.1 3-oxoacyl-ACP reductase family protein [Dehalococcoidia bacterium]